MVGAAFQDDASVMGKSAAELAAEEKAEKEAAERREKADAEKKKRDEAAEKKKREEAAAAKLAPPARDPDAKTQPAVARYCRCAGGEWVHKWLMIKRLKLKVMMEMLLRTLMEIQFTNLNGENAQKLQLITLPTGCNLRLKLLKVLLLTQSQN